MTALPPDPPTGPVTGGGDAVEAPSDPLPDGGSTTCSSCAADMGPTARFCPSCGAARPGGGARPATGPPGPDFTAGGADLGRAPAAPPADVAATPPTPPPGAGNGGRRIDRRALIAILTIVTLAVAISIVMVTRAREKADETGATTTTTARTIPADYATFSDPEAGLTLRYPKEWSTVAEKIGDLRLALSVGPANLDAVTVRVDGIAADFNAGTAENFKAVTDAIVGEDTKVVQQQPVTGPLPGYYYLYTFTDPETNLEGVHAHYFLFSGRKMFTIVFQALPGDGFQRLAPTFDLIAESITSDPSVPAPAPRPTPTTAG